MISLEVKMSEMQMGSVAVIVCYLLSVVISQYLHHVDKHLK